MYHGVQTIFARYWHAYGGSKALLRSPYLHFALVLLVITWGTWSRPLWWDLAIDVLPSLLGFTLGGFAIFLGFGDEKFRALLSERDEDEPDETSPYVGLCATFAHFVLIQVLALTVSLVAKAWAGSVIPPDALDKCLSFPWLILSGLGYGLFLYSVTSSLAASFHVFRIATMYEMFRNHS